MCGIFGINTKNHNACAVLLQALARLEYRGYDSAGITAIVNNQFLTQKVVGKIALLAQKYEQEGIPSASIGIGHTRWATHGKPTLANAHPITKTRVAVVHNGIIENHLELRRELTQLGYEFSGDTDTEVIPNLLEYYSDQGKAPQQAVRAALARLHGAFALLIVFKDVEDTIFATKHGVPLALGLADDALYVSSDAMALAPFARRMVYLEDGDITAVGKENYQIFTVDGQEITRAIVQVDASAAADSKGAFAHYMLKEIYEQPQVLAEILTHYFTNEQDIVFPDVNIDWAAVKNITIIACGTSYYAGCVAKYWFEQLAKLPTNVDIASEFRYRAPVLVGGTLLICISQSGETADTLAALKMAKSHNVMTLGIVNVKQSSIANLAHNVLYTHAGTEVGVASTKAFTGQLMVLALLALRIAFAQQHLTATQLTTHYRNLAAIPGKLTEFLHTNNIQQLAAELALASHLIYVGRGVSYPIALEGALKAKELSYIPAEGIALGELKHGSLALIDKDCPVIITAPFDDLFAKTASNIQEVHARDGKIVVISDAQGIAGLKNLYHQAITVSYPSAGALISPFINTLPLQLLAYYLALAKQRDIDKPRNLSKSVTVE